MNKLQEILLAIYPDLANGLAYKYNSWNISWLTIIKLQFELSSDRCFITSKIYTPLF